LGTGCTYVCRLFDRKGRNNRKKEKGRKGSNKQLNKQRKKVKNKVRTNKLKEKQNKEISSGTLRCVL
jgi:hypothetical protein